MSAAFAKLMVAWERQVAADHSLAAGALRVAMCLRDFFNEGEGGDAWPSIDSLAEMIGGDQHRRLVLRGIKALEAAGHLEVRRGGGSGRTNRYRMKLRGETATQATPFNSVTADTVEPEKQGHRWQETASYVAETVTQVTENSVTGDARTSHEPPNNLLGNRRGRSRGSRMHPDAILGDEWIQEAENLGLSLEWAEREFDRFRDHWLSQPGAKGMKADWLATWRNWCRRAAEWQRQSPKTKNGRQSAQDQLSGRTPLFGGRQ